MLNLFNKKYLSYLLLIFPPALVSGPFLPDLILTIASIFFVIFLIINKKINFLNTDFSKIFLVFYAFILLSSIFSDEVLFSLKNTFFYIRFLIFSYLLRFLIIYEKNFFKLFIQSLMITLAIISIDAIIEYFRGSHWLFDKSFYPEFEGSYRISGLFDEEFILGGFVLSFFPIVLFLQFKFIKKNNFLKYSFLITSILLFIITIIISGERATLAKLILFLIIASIFTSIIKTFKRKIIFFILFALILFISIFSQPKLTQRIVFHTLNLVLDTKNDEKIGVDLSLKEYFEKNDFKNMNVKYFSKAHHDHAIVSFRMFNDKKIMGHGVKMFRFKCEEKKYYLNKRSCSTHAHGIVLSFLAETGLIGLSFLLIMYFFLLRNIFKESINSEKIILISIFVYLFPLLPMGYFFNNFFSLILYTLIGIYLGSKKIREKI